MSTRSGIDVASAQARALGRLLAHRRVKLGYNSARALSRATGLDYRTITYIENGLREELDRNTVARLEVALEWEPGTIEAYLAEAPDTSVALMVEGTHEPEAVRSALVIAQAAFDAALQLIEARSA